jgi:hypothetical protein
MASIKGNQVDGASAGFGNLPVVTCELYRDMSGGNKPTGKHRDFVDIVKFSVTFSIETCPEVCHENLCAFV